jgi:hypothetical protein
MIDEDNGHGEIDTWTQSNHVHVRKGGIADIGK